MFGIKSPVARWIGDAGKYAFLHSNLHTTRQENFQNQLVAAQRGWPVTLAGLTPQQSIRLHQAVLQQRKQKPAGWGAFSPANIGKGLLGAGQEFTHPFAGAGGRVAAGSFPSFQQLIGMGSNLYSLSKPGASRFGPPAR